MDANEVDGATTIVEQFMAQNAPRDVYLAWITVAEAADRYAGLLD